MAPPADVEFEDYSQGVKPAASDNAPHLPKVRIKQLFKKNKVHTHLSVCERLALDEETAAYLHILFQPFETDSIY